jgi:hypothetical protein
VSHLAFSHRQPLLFVIILTMHEAGIA